MQEIKILSVKLIEQIFSYTSILNPLLVNDINENKAKQSTFTATIVEPTGVPAITAAAIPTKAQTTDTIAEQIVTDLKLLNTLIDESAGKIISAETRRVPTKFIERTIIIAIITAKIRLYNFVFTPTDVAKFSSKVRAKILLYKIEYRIITTKDKIMQAITSENDRVNIKVDPKSVVQTSPEMFAEPEYRFIKR